MALIKLFSFICPNGSSNTVPRFSAQHVYDWHLNCPEFHSLAMEHFGKGLHQFVDIVPAGVGAACGLHVPGRPLNVFGLRPVLSSVKAFT